MPSRFKKDTDCRGNCASAVVSTGVSRKTIVLEHVLIFPEATISSLCELKYYIPVTCLPLNEEIKYMLVVYTITYQLTFGILRTRNLYPAPPPTRAARFPLETRGTVPGSPVTLGQQRPLFMSPLGSQSTQHLSLNSLLCASSGYSLHLRPNTVIYEGALCSGVLLCQDQQRQPD